MGKNRSAIIPRITLVAFALVSCNAYATSSGVLANQRAAAGRSSKMSRHASVPGDVDVDVASAVRRFFPVVRAPMTNGLTDLTTLLSTGSDRAATAVAAAATRFPGKKANFVNITVAVTSVLVAFACVFASTASRCLVVDTLWSLLASYKTTMVQYPLETKVATGAILAVLGDALAQMRDSAQKKAYYDPRRAASFAAFDGCYRVFQHNAFPFIISICQGSMLTSILSKLPGMVVGTNLRQGLAALERTLVYQLVVIPLLYYPIFFSFTGYLQGLKPVEILQRAKTSFLPCWKRNLMFWIPTQMVMFGLIDEKWQIPFACLMGMLWSTILSVTAGNASKGVSKKA